MLCKFGERINFHFRQTKFPKKLAYTITAKICQIAMTENRLRCRAPLSLLLSSPVASCQFPVATPLYTNCDTRPSWAQGLSGSCAAVVLPRSLRRTISSPLWLPSMACPANWRMYPPTNAPADQYHRCGISRIGAAMKHAGIPIMCSTMLVGFRWRSSHLSSQFFITCIPGFCVFCGSFRGLA
jgi:hypothetical protein